MKTIQLIVASDGSTRLETRGFAGESCRDASRFLEQALGVCLTESLTPEFHSAIPDQEREREQL